MKFVIIAALVALAGAQTTVPPEVCYEDLGCFSTAPPFTAPGRTAVLPEDPSHVATEFWLFTRKNPASEQNIKARDVASVQHSHFDGLKPSKVLVSGYMDHRLVYVNWMRDMARQFLAVEDVNLLIVDWRKGTSDLFPKAAANARLVGAQLARMITFLHNETGADYASFHIIGHSLGAHIAGYTGKRLEKLGRITALDPTGPFFQNVDPVVRLNATDALFVDVIHTDAADPWEIDNALITGMLHGIGLMQPVGHVDIYPNGGRGQPGCGFHPIYQIIKDGILDGIRNTVACDSMRSYDFFLETLAPSCPWRSYRCDGGYDVFKTGKCLHCPVDGDKTAVCNGVGSLVTKPSDNSDGNKFYMATGDKAPYCRYHYHLQVNLTSDANKEQKGKLFVKLTGRHVQTGFLQANEDFVYLKPSGVYDFLLVSTEEVRDISTIEFKWEHDAAFYEIIGWFKKPWIFPASVSIFSGEFQQQIKFCDSEGKLESKKARLLTRTC